MRTLNAAGERVGFPLFREVSIRSIYAVWRRHVSLYRKTWLTNLIPPVSEPIIYLIGFGLGFGPLIAQVTTQGKTMGYLEFLASGMVATGVLFQSFFEAVYGTFVRIRFQGVWQAMLTTPLSFGDVFLGDLLWATTKGIITGILTCAVAVAWGALPAMHLLTCLPIIIIGSVVFAALGMLSAGLVRSIDEVNVPAFLLVVPMPLFCGAYFPRDLLPQGIIAVTKYVPLTPLVDLLRTPFASDYSGGICNILWLVVWFFLLSYPAAILLRRKVIR